MELVEQAGAGLVVEPEDADSLAESILKLYENRNLAKQLGENGYNYAASHCRRAKIADEYVGHLMEIGGS